jgi:hypothetical protein
MKILNYSTHRKPVPYIAVECDDKNVYEVPLNHFFEYLFGIDPDLEQYYIKNHSNYKELYVDLIDIGIDIEEKLYLFLNDYSVAQYIYPIPQSIYSIVLKWYRGEADDIDKEIINLYFLTAGMPPPHPDSDTGV